MKVLILANYDVGLYQFRKELIEELLKTNDVFISLPYGELVEPLKEMGCTFIDTPVDRRGINPFRDLALLNKYKKMLKELRPDKVIAYTIKPDIYGGYASGKLGISFYANITGLGTTFQNDGLLKKIVVRMYKSALKKAETVFFENSENRQTFIDSGIVSSDRTCLLNGAGVNLEHYKVTDYPEGDTTRFLFVGRVMKEKGIDELFEAMRRLVSEGFNVHLDVLGIPEEDYQAEMDRCENEGWLTCHGYQKDVRPFINASHCLVLPSWHEGMANTTLECAASGRPVIVSNIHGCMEAVSDGKSGFLCEKQNAESLYSVMKDYTHLSFEERRQMGLAGRALMEKNFDKKMIVKKTVDRIFGLEETC